MCQVREMQIDGSKRVVRLSIKKCLNAFGPKRFDVAKVTSIAFKLRSSID